MHTVIENAHAIKTGTLKGEAFSPIRVWRDTEGNVWTLDHRRYMQSVLANQKDIEVVWVSEKVVLHDMTKFDNIPNAGKTYILLGNHQVLEVPLQH